MTACPLNHLSLGVLIDGAIFWLIRKMASWLKGGHRTWGLLQKISTLLGGLDSHFV